MKQKIAILLLTAVLSLCSTNIWAPKTVMFSAYVCAERDFMAQLYWGENENDGFRDDKFLLTRVCRGKSRLCIMIPAKHLAKFRFDFGTNPGEVSLSEMKLSGSDEVFLHPADFRFSHGVDSHRTNEEPPSLCIISNGKTKDPYAVYAKPLSVTEGVTFSIIWFKLPIIVLYIAFLFLVSHFIVTMVGRIAKRIAGCMRTDTLCTDDDGRVVSFDVMRVIAFLLVVFHHVLAHADRLPKFINYGRLGVSFFFVLSGAALSIGSFSGVNLIGFYRKRLRQILPSFWLAYLVCLVIGFALYNTTALNGDLTKIVQTVFGMDGYLRSQHANYYLIGEWYLGCILLTYLLAPFLNKLASKAPLATFAGCLALAILSIRYTPELGNVFSFWNKIPTFNVFPHLPEFVFGMVFWRFVRPFFKRYALFAGVAAAYLICYLCFADEIAFQCSALGILASISAFVAMCFAFDMTPVSNCRNVVAFLAKTSFLAFLYHHQLIGWLIKNGSCPDAQHLAYETLLIASLSFALAYMSLKPVDAIKRMVFGAAK